jgi:hypothetical protein
MSFDIKVSLFSMESLHVRCENDQNNTPLREPNPIRSASFSPSSATKTQTRTSKSGGNSEPEQPFNLLGFLGGMFPPPNSVQAPARRPSTVPNHHSTKIRPANTLPVKETPVLSRSVNGPTRSSATVSQSSTKMQKDARFFLDFVAIYEYRLNHQETSRHRKEQLEDLNYLKQNFNKFTRIFKENLDKKVNFIRTLENLPTNKLTLRENHDGCIRAAQRYFYHPNQDLSFQQRAIEERIETLTPKKSSPKTETYIEDNGRSEQMKNHIAERENLRREGRKLSRISANIDPKELEAHRLQHQIDTNPNESWSLPPSRNPYYDPIAGLDPGKLAALPDKAINKALKLAGKGVTRIKESSTYYELEKHTKHFWDWVKEPAEPSRMSINGAQYKFFSRLWANNKNEGGGRGGR